MIQVGQVFTRTGVAHDGIEYRQEMTITAKGPKRTVYVLKSFWVSPGTGLPTSAEHGSWFTTDDSIDVPYSRYTYGVEGPWTEQVQESDPVADEVAQVAQLPAGASDLYARIETARLAMMPFYTYLEDAELDQVISLAGECHTVAKDLGLSVRMFWGDASIAAKAERYQRQARRDEELSFWNVDADDEEDLSGPLLTDAEMEALEAQIEQMEDAIFGDDDFDADDDEPEALYTVTVLVEGALDGEEGYQDWDQANDAFDDLVADLKEEGTTGAEVMLYDAGECRNRRVWSSDDANLSPYNPHARFMLLTDPRIAASLQGTTTGRLSCNQSNVSAVPRSEGDLSYLLNMS